MNDWTPVTSSHVSSVRHDPDTSTFHVRFKGGGVYTLENVSEKEFDEFMAASSKGQHFNIMKQGRDVTRIG